MTRILLISGSTRDESLHAAALRTASRFAPAGITSHHFDGLRTLPAFVPGDEPAPEPIGNLRQWVMTSDALLFCTPQYGGSLPGSLKNLLDWLVDGGDLGGKPVAWLSVAAPGHDNGALDELERVLGHARARLLRPACIRIPLTAAAIDGEGVVADEHLLMALQDMLHALVRSLTTQEPRQPSWQVNSSLYPLLPPTGGPAVHHPYGGPTHFPATGRTEVSGSGSGQGTPYGGQGGGAGTHAFTTTAHAAPSAAAPGASSVPAVPVTEHTDFAADRYGDSPGQFGPGTPTTPFGRGSTGRAAPRPHDGHGS